MKFLKKIGQILVVIIYWGLLCLAIIPPLFLLALVFVILLIIYILIMVFSTIFEFVLPQNAKTKERRKDN